MTLLYVDIDGALPRDMMQRVYRVCRHLRWPIEAVRFDRTRRGWHVIVGVRKRISGVSVVAAQAILGSDPAREMFNLFRARRLRFVGPEQRKMFNVLYSTHRRGVRL